MKKNRIKFIYTLLLLSFLSCDSYLDVNEDPNVSTDVPSELLFKGMELANVQVQSGHLMRISQFWTGQMRGVASLYARINDYIITPEESNDVWFFAYHGIMTQNDLIQANSQDNLVKGMANIVEAHAIGSMASMFGDIPYSKVGVDAAPAFDKQKDVYQALQTLLDNAIVQLKTVPAARRFTDDILLGGNPTSWIQVAYTLKARYFLMTREYPLAYQNALLGISSNANSLRYAKAYTGYGTTNENSNLYFLVLSGSRSGDLSTNGSFIQDFLDITKITSRNNAKTNENRRRDYLILDQNAKTSTRLCAANATMPLVTYEENLLILAETGFRTLGFNEGLTRLNTLRSFLNTGTAFSGNPALTLLYSPYVSADFNAGGIENLTSITPDKALLREIMEERYISCFGTLVVFDDFRRIKKTDNDIRVQVPLNGTSSTKYPERFLIALDEINGNPNAPSPIPDLYTPTQVNQ